MQIQQLFLNPKVQRNLQYVSVEGTENINSLDNLVNIADAISNDIVEGRETKFSPQSVRIYRDDIYIGSVVDGSHKDI